MLEIQSCDGRRVARGADEVWRVSRSDRHERCGRVRPSRERVGASRKIERERLTALAAAAARAAGRAGAAGCASAVAAVAAVATRYVDQTCNGCAFALANQQHGQTAAAAACA